MSYGRKVIIGIIISGILFFTVINLYVEHISNPENKYRAENTSYTANTVIIDDFYTLRSISASFAFIAYNDTDSPSLYTKSYGKSIEKFA